MKLRRNFYGIVLVLFLSAFVYAVISMKRTFVRHTGRIPYVWPPGLNSTLARHLSTRPTRNILLITGPYQCGKSRAMNIAAKSMLQSKHFVINIDASNAFSDKDLIEIIKTATYRGLVNLFPLVSYSKLKKATKDYHTNVNWEITDLDPTVRAIYSQLAMELDESLINPYSFVLFLDDLESLSETLQPVIFIHGLDVIKEKAPSLYNVGKGRIEKLQLYNDNVPIVCEIRDSSFFINKTMPLYVKIHEIKELKDPSRELIVSKHVFSSIELNKILSNFGGHGGTIERVFEDLKAGINIDKSIDIQQNAVSRYLKRLLKDNIPQEQLNKLCNNNGTMKINNPQKLELLVPLFKSEHLLLTDNHLVKIAHKGVYKSLCGKSI